MTVFNHKLKVISHTVTSRVGVQFLSGAVDPQLPGFRTVVCAPDLLVQVEREGKRYLVVADRDYWELHHIALQGDEGIALSETNHGLVTMDRKGGEV